MKLRRVMTVAAVLLISIPICPAQARREGGVAPGPPPPRPYVPGQTRELILKRRLEKLLPGVSVPDEMVRDTDESPAPSSYRMLHVRWETIDPAAPELTELPPVETGPGPPYAGRVMKIVERREGKGALGRLRGLDLSSESLLYIAVDASQRLRHWYVVADPRVVTTEVPPGPGIAGQARRVFHRSRAEFYVGVPDDPRITELRFYHPRWTGEEYVLELSGVLAL